MNGCPLYDDIAKLLRDQDPPSLSPELAQGVIAAQEKRALPDGKALVQFCHGLGLDFFRTLALLLKREWEGLGEVVEDGLADEMDVPTATDGLPNHPFKPDTATLFHWFESREQWASRSGYTHDIFDALVHEMLLAQLHLSENAGPEVAAFAQRAQNQINLLVGETPQIEQAFWEAKINWIYLQEELGDKLLLLEFRRLKNAHINKEWMMLFGSAHILLEEQTQRFELLQLKTIFLEADPQLSAQALDEMVQGISEEMKQKLNNLRIELAMTAYRQPPGSGQPVDNEWLSTYLAQCKKALRQIWMLIHPDRLCRHPSYDKLTPDQKHQLQELWHRVLRVRPEELRYNADQIGYSYRSDLILRDILNKVRTILQFAGIDIDTDLIIMGDTLAEQLEWLEQANKRLTTEINNVTAELKALIEDPLILEKAAMLTCAGEKQDKIQDKLMEKAAEIRAQADALEQQLEAQLSHADPSD